MSLPAPSPFVAPVPPELTQAIRSANIPESLVTMLGRLFVRPLPVLPRPEEQTFLTGGGVYLGEHGLGLAVVRSLFLLESGVLKGHKALFDNCQHLVGTIIESTIEKRIHRRVTLLEGFAGVAMAKATLVQHTRSHMAVGVAQVEEVLGVPAHWALPPGECDVLYGRAGYLQALLGLLQLPDVQAQARGNAEWWQRVCATMAAVAAEMIHEGRRTARATQFAGPLMWMWHDSFYVGAAHGAVGVFATLLALPSSVGAATAQIVGAPSAAALQAELLAGLRAVLEAAAMPSGNTASSLPQKGRDKLVQFCHGAPGVAIALGSLLLKNANPVQDMLRLPQPEADVLVQMVVRSAAVTFSRPITDSAGLCHGTAGNGYVFLLLAAIEPQRRDFWMAHAELFAQHTAVLIVGPERQDLEGDAAWSLFEGLAGGIAFLSDYLLMAADRTKHVTFPGFML